MIATVHTTSSNETVPPFVYRAVHDLRSPVMSLKGLIYLIQMESEKDQQAIYFGLLEKSVERLNVAITDIIREVKGESNTNRVEPISFQELIQESLQSLRFMEDASSVAMELSVTDTGMFLSNQKSLNSIFFNLISNAIRYRDRSKESFLKINVIVNENDAQITLEDNGIGIEEVHQELVFDKFFMVSADRNGTGLGLHLVQESVQNLKGHISVKSSLGVGTTFTVFIPNQWTKINA
jgi:signal transduction histidine kinase